MPPDTGLSRRVWHSSTNRKSYTVEGEPSSEQVQGTNSWIDQVLSIVISGPCLCIEVVIECSEWLLFPSQELRSEMPLQVI